MSNQTDDENNMHVSQSVITGYIQSNERIQSFEYKPIVARSDKAKGDNILGTTGKNLAGRTFGQLIVLEETAYRDRKRSIIWKCKCSCGKVCQYSQDQLVHHKIVSCGCYRDTVLKYNLNKGLHRLEGTCLERLGLTKARADSKSGHIGVYITANGHYRASIGFKGKRYYLGTFSKLQDAIAARKKAERLHIEFLDEIKCTRNGLLTHKDET